MLRMRGISRWFHATGIQALDAVDFDLAPGEIHAIVGENGAGKSTLVRIGAGHLEAASGSIEIDGRVHARLSVASALASGVGLVPQYPALVKELSLRDDSILGAEEGVGPFLSRRVSRQRWQELVCALGLSIDGKLPVSEASAAECQLARLVALLLRKPRYLLLDELSAILGDSERNTLHELLPRLAGEGLGIALVSHRLDEVQALADTVTILRQGRKVIDRSRSLADSPPLKCREPGFDLAGLEALMFGSAGDNREKTVPADSSTAPPLRRNDTSGKTALAFHSVSAAPPLWPAVRDISFILKAGSITGLAGIREAGVDTLEQLAGGTLAPDSGWIDHAGARAADAAGADTRGADAAGADTRGADTRGADTRGRQAAQRVRLLREAGISWITAGRDLAMLPERLSLAEALAAVQSTRFTRSRKSFFIDRQRLMSATATLIEEAGIRARPEQTCGSLSGGSRQRFAAARELSRQGFLLVAAEPFQGLDRKSARSLEGRMRAWRDRGGAVLFISADLDALIGLADRLLVLADGRIEGDFSLSSDAERRRARELAPALMAGRRSCEESLNA